MPLLCLEKVDAGPCRALKPRFFYNVTSEQCESFNYGGCDGNSNRFDGLEQCQSTCRAGKQILGILDPRAAELAAGRRPEKNAA